jgi:hypothetical protein
MTAEINELLQRDRQLELKKIAGTTKNIKINERTIEAYKEAYREKGMEPEGEKDYPKEDYHLVSKQKKFDALVDPKLGIRKVIESMVRQPITIFDKNGKAQIKDALYYSGYWYGTNKRGDDLGAPFKEGFYRRPRLIFNVSNTGQTKLDYDEQGERRGTWIVGSTIMEHYIFLSEEKKERRKQIQAIINECVDTYPANLESRGGLHYRDPSANNDHSGGHGGGFTWDVFCDLSLKQLGELQNKNYYADDDGIIRDKTGQRVSYDPSSKKVETTAGR